MREWWFEVGKFTPFSLVNGKEEPTPISFSLSRREKRTKATRRRGNQIKKTRPDERCDVYIFHSFFLLFFSLFFLVVAVSAADELHTTTAAAAADFETSELIVQSRSRHIR